jgi:type IV secretion system protein VirD4
MHKLTRFMLIATVMLAAYCVVMLVILVPWAWVALAIGALYGLAKRGYRYTAFGSARWADASDLEGMLDGQGLIIGRIGSKPTLKVWPLFNPRIASAVACDLFLARFRRKRPQIVTLSKAVHTAVFAPTGVGKGVSCVIPHLLTCPDSTVVVDFKGENARITAKARRAMGHRVVLLDPFKVVTKEPDTFNPLDFIEGTNALDECRDLAEALVVRTGQEKEPHWADSAELWIAAMIAAVAHFGDGSDRSLQAVRMLLTDQQKMEAIIKLMCESDAYDGMLSRLAHQLTHFREKELGSTLTTTNRFMRFLDTPAIAESTVDSSFDPADLLKGKVTVYLILPPEHMRAQSALLRMWIGSLLRAVVRGGLQEKNKVHVLLDEAATLGRMEQLSDALAIGRGYGLRLQFYYQDCGQLNKCWPDGADQTLLANTTQVFFGVNNYETAEYVSNRLGEFTQVVTSGGTSGGTSRQYGEHGHGSNSYSENWSDNWQQAGRKLLKPEEVMALSERTAITFTPDAPPIRSTLLRYYEGLPRPRRFAGVKALWDSLCLLLVAAMLAALLSGMTGGLNASTPAAPPQDDWFFK